MAAQPRRKDPAPPSRPRARGSRPDLVKRDSRRRQARDEVGGRHPPVSESGRDSICLAAVPGCCTRKVVGYATGVTARGTGPDMRGDRYGGPQVPDEEGKTIHPAPGRGIPVHLRAARQAPERLRHSSFGGQDRGVLGGCLGGSRRVRPSRNERAHANGVPHETQGHQRYCLPGRAWYTSQTRLHSALGYRTPNEAEHDLVSSNKAA